MAKKSFGGFPFQHQVFYDKNFYPATAPHMYEWDEIYTIMFFINNPSFCEYFFAENPSPIANYDPDTVIDLTSD